MKRTTTIISVSNPSPIDNNVLGAMFGTSQAISEAVGKFWDTKLAAKATLGQVTKTNTGYDVEIKYKA